MIFGPSKSNLCTFLIAVPSLRGGHGSLWSPSLIRYCLLIDILSGWSERFFGTRADVEYNQELKTISAFGLDFDLVFALDQFILILTEFVAYVTTDVLFRTFWPV